MSKKSLLFDFLVFLLVFTTIVFENSTILPSSHIIALVFVFIAFVCLKQRIVLGKIVMIVACFVIYSFLLPDYSEGLWARIGLPQMPTTLLICFLTFVLLYSQDNVILLRKSFIYSCIGLTIIVLLLLNVKILHGMHTDEASEVFVKYGYNSNSIGIKLCFGSMLCLLDKKKKWYKNLEFIYLLSFALLSGSRSVFLFYLLFILSFVWTLGIKNKIKYGIILTLSLIIFIVLMQNVPSLYNLIGARFEKLFQVIRKYQNDKDFSTIHETRLRMMIIGWDYFKSSPIFGNGISSFSYQYSIINNQAAVYSHSNIIELLCNMGIVGFIIYYSQHIYLIRRVKKIRQNRDKRGCLLVAILFTMLFSGISTIDYYYKFHYILLAIIAIEVKNFEYFKEVFIKEISHENSISNT